MYSGLFNDTATTEIYTLSLHDALPISARVLRGHQHARLPAARRAVDAPRDDAAEPDPRHHQDRKSTRLNSSHANISYAVFCLHKTDDGDYLRTNVGDGHTPQR